MTNQQGAPEALRLAESLERRTTSWTEKSFAAVELRRIHAENVRLQQELIRESHRTAEQKLRADQMTRQHADQAAMNREARAQLAALVDAQQPAPSAAVALSDDLRDGLVAISAAIADQDDRAAQAMLREILAAPQPSTTPPADSHPAPVLLSDEELCQIEEPYLLNFRIPLGGQYDFARAVEKAVLAKTYGTQAPQPSPTPQADSQPAADEDIAMSRTQDLAESGRWPSDWVEAYRRGYSDRAARALADSVLEDATRAAARALSDRVAEMCNVDKEDHWEYHSDDVLSDAELVISTYLAARAPAESVTAPAGADVRRSDLVPGVMHCAKCKFQLNRVTLCVSDGNAYAGDNKTEPCPNGCGPLWPVTWEQEARNCWKTLEEMHERLQAAPAAGAVAGPVDQWQKRHPTKTEGKWENTNEADAKWWRDNSPGWEVRALYAAAPTPPTQTADGVLEDAARLDWLALAGPTSICVVIDRPHDSEVEVATDDVTGYGKTLREAIDAATAANGGNK